MALDTYALSDVDSFTLYAAPQGCSASTARIESLINAASAMIERVANRRFKARDYVEWINGQWQEQLTLKNYPVQYVRRVAYGNNIALNITWNAATVAAQLWTSETGITLETLASNGTRTTTSVSNTTYPTLSTMVTAINAIGPFTASLGSTDGPSDEICPGIYGSFNSNANTTYVYNVAFDQPTRFVQRDAGIIGFAGSGWAQWGNSVPVMGNSIVYPTGAFAPIGFQGLMVKYRAGYDTVPSDVQELCNEIAAFLFYQAGGNTAMQSESIGDYSYTRGQLMATQQAFYDRIKTFANISIGGGV